MPHSPTRISSAKPKAVARLTPLRPGPAADPFFPGCLQLSVGLGVDRTGHFGGTLQPLQQAVDPTQGVAGPVLLPDPVSNLPSGPEPSRGHRIGPLAFRLRPQPWLKPPASPLVPAHLGQAALSIPGYPALHGSVVGAHHLGHPTQAPPTA